MKSNRFWKRKISQEKIITENFHLSNYGDLENILTRQNLKK